MEKFDVEKLYTYLNGSLKERLKICYTHITDSTNTQVKALGVRESEGYVLIAGEQTAGRGRMDRSFFSPRGTGLYMSILLKPRIRPEDALKITTAAAVSVCEALERTGVKNTGIKWVNDIFLDGKKVCGILAESVINPADGMLWYAVLGMGLNLYAPENGFPRELEDIAGCIFSNREEEHFYKLVSEILNSFFSYYDELEKGEYIPSYIEKSIVVGKEGYIVRGKESLKVKILGITEECHLLVRYENGEEDEIYAGEVSLRI